ncbi:hypothetical protein AADZ86_00650 [Colwelliaceae bacterium BS250]
MKQILITILLVITSTSVLASELESEPKSSLKSDEMCQQYVTGLFTDISQAEQVGMQALRVSLNRIADTHPEYLDIATQVAFGTALDDKGHRRVGQYINAMCTQDGSVLNDIVYDVLLKESIKLSEGKAKATKGK